MAKIAQELEQALTQRELMGTPGGTCGRVLARGDGWIVEDVICTCGPQDRPFEEQHSQVTIALVTAGTFQYRSVAGRELMTPGSLMLGNPQQYFQCDHAHATGDRCLSFRYAPDYFGRLVEGVSSSWCKVGFRSLRVPPIRAIGLLVARAFCGLAGFAPWEELSIALAGRVVELAEGKPTFTMTPSALARVTRAVHMIESDPSGELMLANLAGEAGLSPYHFLRTFERLTGLTPHQYVRRSRLREAAIHLAAEPAKVVDVALDAGFGDVSNFNHAFRAEFGLSPRAYRQQISSKPGAVAGSFL